MKFNLVANTTTGNNIEVIKYTANTVYISPEVYENWRLMAFHRSANDFISMSTRLVKDLEDASDTASCISI